MTESFWNNEFIGNTVRDFGIALAVFLGLIIVFNLFQRYLLYRLGKLAKKTKTDIDDAVIEIFRTIRPPFYSFIAFYIAITTLNLPTIVTNIISAILIIWIITLAVKAVQIFINFLFKKKLEQEDDRGTRSAIRAINIIAKLLLWSFGILLILSNLGVNITSLIAGLGIGGVAVALAVQNILNDLFSSFAIYFDKPFVVGDFVIVGDHAGIIEKIGIKTTRLRALQGEEIVISNKELTSTRIQNFKKMQERRISFTIGVTYNTSIEKLKKIPGLIKNIIERIEQTRFDRVHFKSFGDFSLNFEIVFYMQTPEYIKYMDTLQDINFQIKETFEKESIDIAFPTQTLFLNKEN